MSTNEYEHTQVGKWTRLTYKVISAFTIGAGILTAVNKHLPRSGGLFVASGVFMACGVVLDSLTVSVSREYVRIRFGIGVIRKSFAVADILTAKVVRNRWYYGWGIRLTPHGWLYSVEGLDAVEIQLRSRRRYRIGTDEPDVLALAIGLVIG